MAVIAVVLSHTGMRGFKGGALGVDVFFTLSGFLITSLLVEELLDRGKVSLRVFWSRRMLRLVPALFALVAAVVAFRRVMPSGTLAAVIPTLLYFTNWYRAFGGDAGALGHAWSLGIEEQFYVLWPLILVVLWRLDRSLRVALRLTLVGAVTVAVFREVAVQTGSVSLDRWYNGFDYRADALLIGCALALAVHAGRLPSWLAHPRVVQGGLVASAVVFMGQNFWGAPIAAGRTFAAVVTAVVISALIGGTTARLSAVLSHPVAQWVGVRSYALYLWHYPICRVVIGQISWLGNVPTRVGLALVLTFTAAAVSYRFVEAPFLRLKDRLGRPATHEAANNLQPPPTGPDRFLPVSGG